jgi:hypothetical protein
MDWWKRFSRIGRPCEPPRLDAGHICVFKLGTKTAVLQEITLDKVECLTWAENMTRNSYHNRLPKEVALLVQLRGQLTRQINRKTKPQEETL